MKIGILGGSFDPAHKGHLAISKEARKRFKLEKIIWAITKKNPLKVESKTPISKKTLGFVLKISFKKNSPCPFCFRLVFLKYFLY